MRGAQGICAFLGATLLWANLVRADDIPDSTSKASPVDAGPTDAAPDPTVSAESERVLIHMVDDAIRRLARAKNDEGLKAFEKKDYPTALRAFREAYELDPQDAEVTNNLAYLYQLLGNVAEAERFYRETLARDPRRTIAYINLAELVTSPRASQANLEEAARLLLKAREQSGNQPRLIQRQARVAARLGRFAEAEGLYRSLPTQDDDEISLEIAGFYEDFGKLDDALSWYRRVKDPEGPLGKAALRIREIEVEREARRYGWSRPSGTLPARAVALVEKANATLREGQPDEATELLTQALKIAPAYALAYRILGDARQSARDPTGAELAYLKAVALDGGEPEALVKLADHYLDHAQPGLAAVFFDRAVKLRPDWGDLHLRLAQAWRAAGDLPQALHAIRRYLAELPEDAPAEEARALERALSQLVGPRELPPTPDGEGDAATRDLLRVLGRARALLAKGEPDAAMAELKSLPKSARRPDVLALEAQILRAAGRLEDAAKALDQALSQLRSVELLEQRAELARAMGRGDQATALLLEAEAQGSLTAGLLLAKLDARAGAEPVWLDDLQRAERLAHAAERVRGYLSSALPVKAADAPALLASLEERLSRVALIKRSAFVALLSLLLVAVLIVLRLRRSGLDLERFIAKHPDAGPEIQRLLSAIRHEVLKHNTLVLTGLIEAIERDQPEAAARAIWCKRSLVGDADGSDGAMHRLIGYTDKLKQIGRAYNVKLSLKRKDKAISALLLGFETILEVAPLLDRVEQLTQRKKTRLVRALKTAAARLNTEGYGAVQALLDRLRVLAVDKTLLDAVFERTAREPGLVEHAPSLVLDTGHVLPVGVAVPRHIFEDILANLIRNAIQSTIKGDRPLGQAVQVGLAIRLELESITGLERVAFFVQDQAKQNISAEVLRNRGIEEGLGLTADSVSRFEGTLDVEPADYPWVKSVVVKLPRYEIGEEST